MLETITGQSYREMMDYGLRNLNKHRKQLNQLNVFPVPDGDTGTNLVTTIKNGLLSIDNTVSDLSVISKKFADSVVFGARGNSGVIMSQFLKGLSEPFFEVESADAQLLSKALNNGVVCAHKAVSNPVEGTILTVVREASNAVAETLTPESSVESVINIFTEQAQLSLERTPELLPALKDAGVVDSGGAGVVYFFKGIKKYLYNEPLESVESTEASALVDYTAFNKESAFSYGYCTELLIQLLSSREEFVFDDFKSLLEDMGESTVISHDRDKVRIHIHTATPENVFSFCHRYGEFLSVKVENMDVQHTETVKNILTSSAKSNSIFSIVTVAHDRKVQKLFVDMGADVAIYCEDSASTKDYVDAFDAVSTPEIIVFPNSSDSELSAIQAKNIYKKANVTVINSRSIAECYASLPIVDFSCENIHEVADLITETISQLYVVSVAHRNKPISYDGKNIQKNEYFAFSGKELLAIKRTLEEAVLQVVYETLQKQPKDVLTIFYGSSVTDEQIDDIIRSVQTVNSCLEVFTVPAEKLPCDLTLSFE